MATPRENAIVALTTLVAAAYAWRTGPLRRLRLWADVPAASRPACFLFEGGSETYSYSQGALPKKVIEPKLFVYLDAKDPSIVGASLINQVLDALDTAFALGGADQAAGRHTLGGAAYNCRIDGKPLKDPGDLDGDALLIVPIKIILP